MSEKRMFSVSIIDSDAFLDLPISAQALYFHLSMRADDDGFVNKPRAIMNMIGARNEDAKVLCDKKFLIPFDSGVVVIKHWRIHNTLRKDTYHETKYKFEKSTLYLDENGSYSQNEQRNGFVTDSLRNCTETETQIRKDKVREDKVREDKNSSVQYSEGKERGLGETPKPPESDLSSESEENMPEWKKEYLKIQAERKARFEGIPKTGDPDIDDTVMRICT